MVLNLELIETIKFLIALVLAYIMLASITGAFQAWVADLMGDSTARSLGMMSLNPFAHVDPISLILLPISFLIFKVIIGLSKPVPIMWNYIGRPLRWFKLTVLALSQPLAIMLLLIFLIVLRLFFIFIAVRTGFNELLLGYHYVFDAVVAFSAWFVPYQLFMAMTQIFVYEQSKGSLSLNQSFLLMFLPLFGALLLRDISYKILVVFISLVNGGLLGLIKIFISF
jgi:hypothetical protein